MAGRKSPALVEKMSDYDNDRAMGEKSEAEVIDVLSKAFNTEFAGTARYATIDFVSDTIEIELKTRNNEKDKYPTTLIPKSKIDYIKNNRRMKKYIFAFKFTDGLYYIEYDDKVFDKIECKMFVRDKRTGWSDAAQLYYYIPVTLLRPVL